MRRLRRWARDQLDAVTAEPDVNLAVTAPNMQHQPVPFQYTPLTLDSSFRVLHLKGRLEDFAVDVNLRPLRGSLLEAQIGAAPEYYALSYTWGEPALCDIIEIDGRQLGITANCGAALRRMLRGKTERHIWVDSICINQANTPEALVERGRQVAMMDQIYRNAVQVNVHLGVGNASTDEACEALKGLAQYYLGAKMPGPQQESFRRKYEELAEDVLTATPEFPFGKLHGIFRLPWFRRTWVIQEVALGRNVMFYCGKHLMHLKTLVIGADFGRLPYSKYDIDLASRHWRTYLDYHDALQEFIRRREEGEPLSSMGLTLSAVLLVPAMGLEATRPEDKIYGLYGVCKRLGFELPVPDYQQPLAVVYTEAARAILRSEPGLGLLSSVCESSAWDRGIPSWVPDFSGNFRKWSPSNPPHMVIMYGKESPAVSGHTQCQYEFMLDGQALKVKGRRLDILSAVGQPWKTDASTNMLGDAQMQTGQYISSLIECIGSWFEVVNQSNDAVAMQLLVQLLSQGVSEHLAAGYIHALNRYVPILVARSRGGGDFHHVPLRDSQDNPLDYVQVGDHLISRGMQSTISGLSTMPWKTVFRTANGYLGVGTHSIQDGDVVIVFYGCSTASILRPWGDWFRYVGPAYVERITSGELWGATSSTTDEWFVLV